MVSHLYLILGVIKENVQLKSSYDRIIEEAEGAYLKVRRSNP